MRKTLRILCISNRGQGKAGTYGERSPEFEQRAAALSCCRCRGYRPCADKREVSVDAHRDAEHDSMNHGQRGVRCSPEFVGAVVGTARLRRGILAAWGRLGLALLGEMAVRGRGLSRQGLDRKRLQNQWQLRRGINASNGQRRRGLRSKFGEDDGDVDGAQLSARETEGGLGPGVSLSAGSSASEREREGTRV